MPAPDHGVTPERMLAGYAAGIFPMAESADAPDLHWIDPPRRGVLPVGAVHASRSTLRNLRRGGWRGHIDRDFEGALRACADRPETWINAELFGAYMALHEAGHAHSFEVTRDGAFAGAMFGIALNAAFFGESMVSARTNGSKLALLWASWALAAGGFTLFDTQFLTTHLVSLGGLEITRTEYRAHLDYALTRPAALPEVLPDAKALHDWAACADGVAGRARRRDR